MVSGTFSRTICPSSKKYLSAKLIMKGIVTLVIHLLHKVRVTDNAVSPFARWAIRLDVGPPGQAARIMIPIEISGFNGNTMAIRNPIIGNRINWLVKPTKIALGYTKILLKSSISSLKALFTVESLWFLLPGSLANSAPVFAKKLNFLNYIPKYLFNRSQIGMIGYLHGN